MGFVMQPQDQMSGWISCSETLNMHAFFQPAEKEMITLLHFHLHNHIMVGNKKTKDVQFYVVEVMDVVQTIGGGKRSAYDPDEIEEEQRERDRKNKINMDFQNFVNRINDLWGTPQFKSLDLEFNQPLRELGFHGVPHKSSAFLHSPYVNLSCGARRATICGNHPQ
ncbi:hypothetical protein ACS0TY_025236 [Phlomoides rotata]